jgi:asparagine synthase (glutamine-hydrolysing)
MCGFLGLINSNFGYIDKNLFRESAKLMSHRGPNAFGQWGINDKIELCHLRLSIVDLKPESNQPFFSICKNYVIVFNGEVYNYIEIREQLISHGYKFVTESDTEVLLNSYIHWGEECVAKFNGDWAFAIYHIEQDKLFCSRDRFGVKPFNYAVVDNNLIFSSEIKSILNYYNKLRQPNFNAIANYCRTSVGAQHEETWFRDIYRLQPAHNLVFQKGVIKQYRYWSYPTETNRNISFEDAKNIYKALFSDSVKLRIRSDVPVGTTLSAGIDSNSIVFTLREIHKDNHHTFTACFDSSEYDQLEKQVYASNDMEIDEAAVVKEATKELNLESHFLNSSYDNFVEDLRRVIYHLESGHSSTAILPLMQVMNFANQHVTVVLEGQGADEMLGYQQKHFISTFIESIRKFKFLNAIEIYRRTSKTYSLSYAIKMYFRYLSNDFQIFYKIYQYSSGLNKLFTSKLRVVKKLTDSPENKGLSFDCRINGELYKQHSGGLVNLLHYGDAISMANSLESRLPFMDYRLVEFAFSLPWDFKIHYDLTKYIHRESMKGSVPDSILNSALKFGFNTPVSQFFKEENRLEVKPLDIILSETCINRGLFNKRYLLRIMKEHDLGIKNHSTLLYRILSVELWFRVFIDSSNFEERL